MRLECRNESLGVGHKCGKSGCIHRRDGHTHAHKANRVRKVLGDIAIHNQLRQVGAQLGMRRHRPHVFDDEVRGSELASHTSCTHLHVPHVHLSQHVHVGSSGDNLTMAPTYKLIISGFGCELGRRHGTSSMLCLFVEINLGLQQHVAIRVGTQIIQLHEVEAVHILLFLQLLLCQNLIGEDPHGLTIEVLMISITMNNIPIC